jgi:HD-like signal output (HDOD) protein/CheY-like chemotaxis protein
VKRILFVDDEPRVLQGLQRLLRPHRDEWEMAFVASGAEALALLDASPFDVIVTDMRMPGMDGAALLTSVRERHPGTVRIVLTGHTELDNALQAAAVAHQVLSTPCEPSALVAAVERAVEVERLLDDVALREAVGGIDTLPSHPRVLAELNRLFMSGTSSSRDIARVVARDPAVSAKVLQLVNSSFFGLARRVTDLEQAVTYLGIGVLHGLIVGAAALRTLEDVEMPPEYPFDAVRAHGAVTANLARAIAGPVEAPDAFVAALLQDVGHLLLLRSLPHYVEVLDEHLQTGRALHDVERQVLGFTHGEVGAYLLALWNLPHPVIDAVAHHHDALDDRRALGVRETVALARRLVNESGTAPDPTDPAARVEPAWVASLASTEQVDEWRRLAATAPTEPAA